MLHNQSADPPQQMQRRPHGLLEEAQSPLSFFSLCICYLAAIPCLHHRLTTAMKYMRDGQLLTF